MLLQYLENVFSMLSHFCDITLLLLDMLYKHFSSKHTDGFRNYHFDSFPFLLMDLDTNLVISRTYQSHICDSSASSTVLPRSHSWVTKSLMRARLWRDWGHRETKEHKHN